MLRSDAGGTGVVVVEDRSGHGDGMRAMATRRRPGRVIRAERATASPGDSGRLETDGAVAGHGCLAGVVAPVPKLERPGERPCRGREAERLVARRSSSVCADQAGSTETPVLRGRPRR